jgi:hypothetical protein
MKIAAKLTFSIGDTAKNIHSPLQKQLLQLLQNYSFECFHLTKELILLTEKSPHANE